MFVMRLTFTVTHTLSTNNKCQRWDPILCCCCTVLNTYVVHDFNGLDAYTLRTVHEQDSVVVRHVKTKVHMCYCLRVMQH